MTKASRAREQRRLLELMRECQGAEIPREDWPLVEELVQRGEARWVSGPRGPNRVWRRAEAT